MVENLRIAVLMTCHNRRETTLCCLDSLARSLAVLNQHLTTTDQQLTTLTIFLNDDGSIDGTSEAVNAWVSSLSATTTSNCNFSLYLIRGSGHDFWAHGMARAWQAAIDHEKSIRANDQQLTTNYYTHFLWLNDDVVLKPDALAILLTDALETAKLQNNQTSVIVGTCSMDTSETTSSYSATTNKDEQLFPNGTPQLADGWFNGNCVLIPRSGYETVGIIDGGYTHARADYDYAERLRKAGIPFYCSSHFIGVCRKDINDRIRNADVLSRCKMLVQPGYLNLHDMWRYRMRHYGLLRACISCAHLIIIAVVGR